MNFEKFKWPVTNDYEYGDSMLATCEVERKNWIYVNIPKNASSWVRKHFPGRRYNFLKNSFTQLPEHLDNLTVPEYRMHYVIVLRDPVDRWITGVSQALGDRRLNNISYSWLLEDLTCGNNVHVTYQNQFLHGIDWSTTTAFMVDATLEMKFHHFMLNFLPGQAKPYLKPHNNVYNKTSLKSPKWQKFVADLSDFVYNNEYVIQAIKDHYHIDYKMISSMDFYEPN